MPTLLTADLTTSPSNPQATASISPAANTAILVHVVHSRNPASTITIAAGAGLDLGTITKLEEDQYGTIAAPTRGNTLFLCSGSASPGSGVINISCTAGAPNGLAWGVAEAPEIDPTSGIIVSAQAHANSGTAPSVTLPDGGGSLSWETTFGFFGNADSTAALGLGSGFSGMWTKTVASSNSFRTRGEYKLSKDTSVDASQSSNAWSAIGIGVVAPSGALTLTPTGSEATAQQGTAGLAMTAAPSGAEATLQAGTPATPFRLLPIGLQAAGESGAPLLLGRLLPLGTEATAQQGTAAALALLVVTLSGNEVSTELPDYSTEALFDLLPDGSQVTGESGLALLTERLAPLGSEVTLQNGTPALAVRLLPVGSEGAGQTGTPALLFRVAPLGLEASAETGAPGLLLQLAPDGLEALAEIGTPTALLLTAVLGVRLTAPTCRASRLAAPAIARSRLAAPTFQPEF